MKIDLKNCSLLITPAKVGITGAGGSSTHGVPDVGDYLLIKFGDGNLTIADRTNITYEKDRGLIDDVRLGDEVPLEVSLTAKYEYIQSPVAGTPSLMDTLDGSLSEGTPHPWAEWQSANLKREDWLDCPPYCVCLELQNDIRVQCPNTTVPGEIIWFPFFRKENAPCSIKGGTIQISGKCNVTDYIAKRVTKEEFNAGYAVGTPALPYDLW